jgi:hypothetical protein
MKVNITLLTTITLAVVTSRCVKVPGELGGSLLEAGWMVDAPGPR